MYHEEKVINGILHYRGTPNGHWIAFTVEQLTERMTKIQSSFDSLNFDALKYVGDLS